MSSDFEAPNGGAAAPFPPAPEIGPTEAASTTGSSGPDPAESTPDDGTGERSAELLESLPASYQRLRRAVDSVVVGHGDAIDATFYALLSRGHCLLVGVPGVGKTLLVRTLGRLLGLPFGRIQFTPDLMPADITGTEILEEDAATGHRSFVFNQGPVFTNLLLADEINRTPPKTQAALLEAMQETTVTVAGAIRPLDEPFLVLATQNPIEQEGTYPLPEAQLDRFLFQMRLGYPTLEDERRVVEQHSFRPTDALEPVLDRPTILALRDAVAKIPAAPNVVDYGVRLTRATRPDDPTASDEARRWVRWGASPRASQMLILAGRARAACQGRFNVAREDLRTVAPWVLRHRLIRTFEAEADGVDNDAILTRVLEGVAD